MKRICTDVVVVGSGAGGLIAAATARRQGQEVIVVESTDYVGGSSAMSGGGLWLPANHYMAALGESDSYEMARAYLEHLAGPTTPGSSTERRDAYIRTAPELSRWLEELGMRMVACAGYPDYYPEAPGGKLQGRGVECLATDQNILGSWAAKIRPGWGLPVYGSEASRMAKMMRSPSNFLTALNAVLVRGGVPRLVGKRMVTAGTALIVQLLDIALRDGVTVWLESPMRELIQSDDGGVIGAIVERDGEPLELLANDGVLLAAGGFEHNRLMREQYLPKPTNERWSTGNPGNVGDAVRAGMAVGAATDLLDEAWWMPAYTFSDGTTGFLLWERALPHSIIVDANGQRFFNEAEPYEDAGRHQYERNRCAPAIPAFHILDARHRRRYPLGRWIPGITPRKAIRSGDIVKASSLDELAAKLGIDSDGLTRTIQRFNGFAESGKDLDFGRGNSAYDRVYGDTAAGPNPNLGRIDKPPYWGLRVWPGDIGTKGGLVTDVDGRVLTDAGTPIKGLYAAGNCTASVTAYTYPGGGGTLGPAAVFAYRAARHTSAAKRQ